MRNAGLEEAQDGIKIARRNINNLRYADDTTLMTESEEELKSILMKVKVESEKVGLKLNIQKMKIMASCPITSWEIDGETVETVLDMSLSELWELVVDRKAWRAAIQGVAKSRTQLSDWTELNWKSLQMVTAAMKLKDTCSLVEKLWPTYTSY